MAGKRFLNRDGTFNIATRARHEVRWRDLYHSMISARFALFFGWIGAAYLAANLVFATLYFLCGPEDFVGMSRANGAGFYLDCFFFSIQTLATIGYGRISPVGILPNILVAIEALAGLMGFAILTGLTFARFSRPTARVRFSHQAIIAPQDGVPTLHFRIANERLNQIVEARVSVTLVMNETTKEGERYRNLYDLALERDHSPLFALTWTIGHPIVAGSPLLGKTARDLEDVEAEILVTLTGMDDTVAQPIHARYSYRPEEIRWNERFSDMITRDPQGLLEVDLERISETLPSA